MGFIVQSSHAITLALAGIHRGHFACQPDQPPALSVVDTCILASLV